MSSQTWTPAPKRGIIPLHPLTFGMLFSRSFAALRHNPKVLFGFGVVVQLIVVVVTAGVMGVVLYTTFLRLESVSPSSPDFEAVAAGVIGMNIIAGIVVTLASVAFTSLMQGVVAAEVGFGALGIKAGLGRLWRRMAPAFWRLAAFSLLAGVVAIAWMLVIFGIIVALIAATGGSGDLIWLIVVVSVILVIGSIPLAIWLSTKLLLVPSALVLERATLRSAIVRSWRLVRGRFWVAWGVTILIGVIMGTAAQVVSYPATMLSGVLGGVIAPTGEPEPTAIIGFVLALMVPQLLVLIIQAISLVVQSTAGTLVYLDCRMRYEGLDQTMMSYVERRDLGWTEDQLGDPFVVDESRAVSKAPPPRQMPEWAAAQAQFAAAQQYAPQWQPGPAPQGYPVQPPQGYPVQPTQGYPVQPTQGYPVQPTQGYPVQPGQAYAPQPGQSYPVQPYPAQPGQQFPPQPGQPHPPPQYPAQPGAAYPGQPGAATTAPPPPASPVSPAPPSGAAPQQPGAAIPPPPTAAPGSAWAPPGPGNGPA